ncbi:MAG TPA: hypothetical protein P5232_00385 [Candidatus Moranbacteria bacterium]|nr:hypothetical protein [Candidatus Moranbacteria bacterium]
MDTQKKLRPIDVSAQKTYSWWTKTYVFIKKTEIKTWQGVFALAFISGAAAAIIWSVSAEWSLFSKASIAVPDNQCIADPSGGSFDKKKSVAIRCGKYVNSAKFQWQGGEEQTIDLTKKSQEKTKLTFLAEQNQYLKIYGTADDGGKNAELLANHIKKRDSLQKNVDGYNATLIELNLKNSPEELEKVAAGIKSELEKAQAKIVEIDKRIAAIENEQLVTLKKTRDDFQKKVDEFKAKLADLTAKNASADRIANVTLSIEKNQAKVANLDAKIAKTENEQLVNIKQDREEFQKKVDELKTKLENTDTKEKRDKKIADFKKTIEENQAKIVDFNSKIAKLEKAIDPENNKFENTYSFTKKILPTEEKDASNIDATLIGEPIDNNIPILDTDTTLINEPVLNDNIPAVNIPSDTTPISIDAKSQGMGLNIDIGSKYYDTGITSPNAMEMTSYPWDVYYTTKYNPDKAITHSNTKGTIPLPKLNENGYPTEKIPYQYNGQDYHLGVHVFSSTQSHYPSGNYTLIFDGAGEIRIRNASKESIFTQGGVKNSVSIDNSDKTGIYLYVLKSDENNPVRNIRLIIPGYEEADRFYPKVFELAKGAKAFRFMGEQKTNGQNIVRWEDRNTPDKINRSWKKIIEGSSANVSLANTGEKMLKKEHVLKITAQAPHKLETGQRINLKPNYALSVSYIDETGAQKEKNFDSAYGLEIEKIDDSSFYLDLRVDAKLKLLSVKGYNNLSWQSIIEPGVPMEDLIDFTNKTEADAWFCVPHLADNEYVREMAKLIKSRLKSGKKVYIEYSNEIWNTAPGFWHQTTYARYMGETDSKIVASKIGPMDAFYTKRALEIFKVFENELGDDRVINVISSQFGLFWHAEQRMKAYDNSDINPDKIQVEALAVAPYFSAGEGKNKTYSTSVTVNELFSLMEKNISEYLEPRRVKHKNLADTYKLDLIAYEGGQSLIADNDTLSTTFTAANKDSRMYDLYKKYFNWWFDNGGGIFMNFEFINAFNQYGYWGILEYMDQPASEAPKYRAFMDFVKK